MSSILFVIIFLAIWEIEGYIFNVIIYSRYSAPICGFFISKMAGYPVSVRSGALTIER
jgi:hypothetical protein